MKKYFIPLIVLVFLTGASFSPKNVEKEKEAIKKVVAECTDAYRAKSLEGMASTWSHKEPIVKLGASKDAYRAIYGWTEVNSFYKQVFEDAPEPSTGKYKKVNWKIKVYKGSAWSIHDELHYNNVEEETGKQIISHFLEKENGKWKIVYMSQIAPSSYE